MPRILLLGKGDLTAETAEALRAADATVERLEDPTHEELRDALDAGADAAVVVSRDDAWPLRAALLVRHLDPDVPIVATIFEPETARELEQVIGNCTDHVGGRHRRSNARRPVPRGRARGGAGRRRPPRRAALQGRSGRAGSAARGARPPGSRSCKRHPKPFDRSAALVFFGAVGLLAVLVLETVAAALVLDQNLVDAFYGAVKTLVTVDPNQEVQDGPEVVQAGRSPPAC